MKSVPTDPTLFAFRLVESAVQTCQRACKFVQFSNVSDVLMNIILKLKTLKTL